MKQITTQEGKNMKATETKSLTQLNEKNKSPLTIRKYTKWGSPIYVGIISDDDLSDLDLVVCNFMNDPDNQGRWRSNNIQKIRNLTGDLSEILVKAFPRTEGLGVLIYADKMFVSSLFGDFMNHLQCKLEFYSMLQMSAHI